MVVVTCGMLLLTSAAFIWQSQDPVRFLSYLALAMAAATLKIRLPYMGGTVTPAFVLLLAVIAQFSIAETIVMAAILGVVQVVWRPARRPMPAQVIFSSAGLVLSAAFAWVLSRVVLEPWLGHGAVGVLVVSTLVLYVANTVMVAAMVALVERKPLSGVWQLCYFWSLPYYLVGAAAAGVMTEVSRNAGWLPSLLVLPLMELVYVCYRMHVSQAVATTVPAQG